MTMTVRELRELLEDLDGDMAVNIAYQPNYPLTSEASHLRVYAGEVYICQNSEGRNGYAPNELFDSDESSTDDLEAANEFWTKAKERVERIASENGLTIHLSDHDDGFLYDMFDCGDYDPTDAEVLEAIKEVQE